MKKIKPVALAQLLSSYTCLKASVSQSVTYIVSHQKILFNKNFHGNLLKAFRVDLKAFLGLVLPRVHNGVESVSDYAIPCEK